MRKNKVEKGIYWGEGIEILDNRPGTKVWTQLRKEASHTGILRKSTSCRRKAEGKDSEMGHTWTAQRNGKEDRDERKPNNEIKILYGDLEANVKTLALTLT